MKNVIELRKELGGILKDLKAGKLSPKTAAQMNNAAGKMLQTVKIQLEYAKDRKEKPSIAFMRTK